MCDQWCGKKTSFTVGTRKPILPISHHHVRDGLNVSEIRKKAETSWIRLEEDVLWS
jgi:hypothetical protein